MKRCGVALCVAVALLVFIASQSVAAVCPGCGAAMKEGWKFCPFCAKKIEPEQPKKCPGCGADTEAGWKACPTCGTLLQGGAPLPLLTQQTKILWDFENERDLSSWNSLDGLKATVVKEQPMGEGAAVKIEFPASPGGVPAFRYQKGTMDFTGYAFLEADCYNPGDKAIGIAVKLKSNEQAKQVTMNYELPPSSAKTIQIRLENIAGRVDLNDVEYLNFFCWHPSEGGTYYMDRIRLTK